MNPRKHLSAAAAFAWILAAVSSLPAQERQLNNWQNLSQLRAGQRIEVIDMGLKRTRGEFAAAAAGELQVRTSNGVVTLPEARVFRVSLLEKSKRLRNALIGAAIGAAAGLATGAAVDRAASEDGEHLGKMLFTPIGAGAGAGLGAAVPGFETIYRAPKRVP